MATGTTLVNFGACLLAVEPAWRGDIVRLQFAWLDAGTSELTQAAPGLEYFLVIVFD